MSSKHGGTKHGPKSKSRLSKGAKAGIGIASTLVLLGAGGTYAHYKAKQHWKNSINSIRSNVKDACIAFSKKYPEDAEKIEHIREISDEISDIYTKSDMPVLVGGIQKMTKDDDALVNTLKAIMGEKDWDYMRKIFMINDKIEGVDVVKFVKENTEGSKFGRSKKSRRPGGFRRSRKSRKSRSTRRRKHRSTRRRKSRKSRK